MKYPLLNKIKIPLVITTISLIILYTPLGGFFTFYIHKYIPCPYAGNYAARYASLCIGYDIIFALFILGILILSLLIIAIKSIKYYRNHKKL